MLLFYLLFHHLLYQIYERFLINDISVYVFNSLPDGDYSSLLIVAAFSGKTFLPVKNSYLSTFFKVKPTS